MSRQSGTSVLCISPWRKFLPSLTYPQKIRRNWFVGNRLREPRSRWPCAAGWFWPLQKDIPIWKSLPTTKSIDTLSRCGESACKPKGSVRSGRSEEHTSELQSHSDLVCRLLLEKKKLHNVNC